MARISVPYAVSDLLRHIGRVMHISGYVERQIKFKMLPCLFSVFVYG